MKFAIVVFPGSNCDQDCLHVAKDLLGCEAELVWHGDRDLKGADIAILPGGFAYGDYLRAGALARFSPVMETVSSFAKGGGLVLGICNGFQVLLEAGLLPGAMRRNANLRFQCKDVWLKTERTGLPFTRKLREGQVLRLPIAHAEGNYEDAPEALDRLEAERRVIFRYCTPEGAVTPEANPNGAARNIAGICNAAGNVLGLMPHPERCSESVLGNTDGLELLAGAVEAGRGALSGATAGARR